MRLFFCTVVYQPIVEKPISLEPFGSEFWEVDVSSRNTSTTDPHRAFLSHGYRVLIIVQDVNGGVG